SLNGIADELVDHGLIEHLDPMNALLRKLLKGALRRALLDRPPNVKRLLFGHGQKSPVPDYIPRFKPVSNKLLETAPIPPGNPSGREILPQTVQHHLVLFVRRLELRDQKQALGVFEILLDLGDRPLEVDLEG